jgi:Tol biopolymer transport system component
MKADGSDQVALTAGDCDGLFGISWSPEGQRIAFTRGCHFEEVELWVMNADGTDMARVADSPAFFPAWSPER